MKEKDIKQIGNMGDFMQEELVKRLYDKGASLVGFAALSPSVRQSYPVGVSIAVAYAREVIQSIVDAPTPEYFNAYHQLNNELDELAIEGAALIKEWGYQAYPQTVASVKQFDDFQTVMPHKTVAVRAGLGWIGKSALFITEPYGSALRLTSILTDAPFVTNREILQSKCHNCLICMHACPAKAITGHEWRENIPRNVYYEAEKCSVKAKEIAAEVLKYVHTPNDI